MTRRLTRILSVAVGYLVALDFSRHDHWAWYGQSHGDDALALVVWVGVSVAMWLVSDRLTARRN
jgi:hypothetical protein